MPLNPKILLPVALGMSLVSVTAFVVYYVFKKDEEEKNDNSVKTSRVNVIEITVSKSIVPALIGKYLQESNWISFHHASSSILLSYHRKNSINKLFLAFEAMHIFSE